MTSSNMRHVLTSTSLPNNSKISELLSARAPQVKLNNKNVVSNCSMTAHTAA